MRDLSWHPDTSDENRLISETDFQAKLLGYMTPMKDVCIRARL